ncbi:PREDICTED: cysteine-rich receptor-like protein kinase 10 isoform X2 [Tarenaya hassleriana]|uniref:cysteine-rich receptor-like protein kinase 10 isoform X2 n=1 Tax=Tarenaya hassleriana TaxID=28532 RepID=UPI00053C8931|nr:PREDICTED: cysteine-rich receptor-like protein kinase 10 isoform X2 [Tarenaya hassleriana]
MELNLPGNASFVSFLIKVVVVMIIISFRACGQDPTYIYHICPNTTTYTRNDSYFTNLETLLTTFSSNDVTYYSTGFQNIPAGQSPDMVIGLFLCRGDISPEVCRGCVAFAANDTLRRCPNEKEALIWYDECILRYSDRNILLVPATDSGIILMNTQNISASQRDRFNDLLFSTMEQAVDEALNSSRKFSTVQVEFTKSEKLYTLVQCTPDLTRQDCESCMRKSINELPRGMLGGRVLLPSCYSRYELYPFSNGSRIPTPPPPPPMSAPPPPPPPGRNSSVVVIAVVVPIAVAVALSIAGYCFLANRGRGTYGRATADDGGDDITTSGSLQFDFRTIEAATDHFSKSNRLGQGGFGEVFKGTLPNGTQVAVKRLSKTSNQGEDEFKNEVVLVAKLQHRNLVRLLGFCTEGEEKILVFEFVPNKSLDYFLFDTTRQSQLDWRTRYKIIGGITRGILYLHQDSRLTIIHRDLKASNILIDADMNPKIADFGMARIFGMDQTEANTKRVVGTYGYMSPEYAMYGQFSMKSDVYSFGVLVLEIISGKKNSNFYQMDDTVDNLVTYAWRQWSSGSPLELVDPIIGENYPKEEAIRCIHLGLLCVQEDPAKRPTLSTIHQMLTNFSICLPMPQEPGFFFGSRQVPDRAANGPGTDKSANNSILCSIDGASITELGPR